MEERVIERASGEVSALELAVREDSGAEVSIGERNINEVASERELQTGRRSRRPKNRSG